MNATAPPRPRRRWRLSWFGVWAFCLLAMVVLAAAYPFPELGSVAPPRAPRQAARAPVRPQVGSAAAKTASLTVSPSDSAPPLDEASELAVRGRYAEALAVLDREEGSLDSSWDDEVAASRHVWGTALAHEHRAAGKLVEASAASRAALAAGGWLRHGNEGQRRFLRDLEEAQRAGRSWQRAQRGDPLARRTIAAARYERGLARAGVGEFLPALDDIAWALALDPERVDDVLFNLEPRALSSETWNRIIEALSEEVASNPLNPRPLLLRALFLFWWVRSSVGAGEGYCLAETLDLARVDLTRVLVLDSQFVAALFLRGAVNAVGSTLSTARRERYAREAIQDLDRASAQCQRVEFARRYRAVASASLSVRGVESNRNPKGCVVPK